MDENNPQQSVPGSKESLTLGEHVGVAQPAAPNPVPATAAPSQDAVSVNAHLRTLENELLSVVAYAKNFLKDHPATGQIVSIAEEAIEIVENNIK